MLTPPTDGHGIYEAISPWDAATYTPRLQQIAAGGFKLVMNYSLLYTTGAHLAAYVNAAAAAGLRLIVALNEKPLWDGTPDISAQYPDLCASAGCHDGPGLVAYVVNLVKGLVGTWGYYMGDEVAPTYHDLLKVHTDHIKSLDSSHPRLFIDGATESVSLALGNSPFVDVADVAGSAHYPLGYYPGKDDVTKDAGYAATIAQQAGIHDFQPAFVCQAMSWQQEYPPARCTPYPSCAPFPSLQEMQQQAGIVLSNMHARVLLWYSYFDVLKSSDPVGNWNNLVTAIGPHMGL